MIFSQVKLATNASASLAGWTNLSNITVDDGVNAVSPTTSQNTNTPYLKLNGFGFSIPDEATIVGVVARVEGKNEIASNTGFFAAAGGLKLLSIANTSKGMTAFTASTLATKVIGGDADLWGAVEITPAQANDSAFGVYALFRNGNTTAQKMSIDKIELEVFYTMPEPDPFTGGGSLPPKNP